MIYVRANFGLGPDVAIWPPGPGLLSDLSARPRNEWAGGDWQQYAELLEKNGYALVQELEKAQAEAAALRSKLRRGKSPTRTPQKLTLLDYFTQKPRRGRPRGSRAESLALLALETKAEMLGQNPGKRITNRAALAEFFRAGGKDLRVEDHRAVLTAMGQMHKKFTTCGSELLCVTCWAEVIIIQHGDT